MVRLPAARIAVVFGLMLAAQASVFGQESAGELLGRAETLIQKEQFTQAEALLRKARQAEPDNTAAGYRLGYVLFRQRKLDGAEQEFLRVVKLAPPALYSRYFLGRIALIRNRAEEAVTWLEPVAASDEPVLDAAAQLSRAYQEAGQHKRALTAVQAAIHRAPWDSGLYYRKGRLYQHLGQPELAKEALATSQRLRNAGRETVEKLHRCADHLSKGERREALQLRDELISDPLANPDALVALGVSLAAAGMQDAALGAFQRAAALDGTSFQAQFNAGLALLKLGRGGEAVAPLERAAALLPQSAEANAALGLVRVLGGQFAEAVLVLERALELEPSNARVSNVLAVAYVRTAQAAKAVPLLRAVIPGSAGDPKPHYLMVEALNQVEDPEGALAAAEGAATLFPGLPQSQLAVAQQLARLGRYQDAGPFFERALELAPGHPDALLGWAEVLEKRGDYERSLAAYRQALSTPGDGLLARLGMGRNLTSLKRFEEARAVLEEALPQHPADTQLRLDLSRVYARLGRSEQATEQMRILQKLRGEEAARKPSP